MTLHPSPITHHFSVRRILVRGPNWIGDAVMCEPALRALRARFPQAEITLLVKPAVASLLRDHPAVTRVLTYEERGRHAGWAGKFVLAGTLRRQRFDAAVLFQNAFEAALLAFLAGIPFRYGYATDGRRLLLTHAVEVPPRAKAEHQTAYYLRMLNPLGEAGADDAPRLYLSEEMRRAAEQRLAEFGVREGDMVIGLNPGSTYGGAKRWLPERFAETADRLVRQYRDLRPVVVIVGANGEEALGQSIAARMSVKPVLMAGATTVAELMGIIRRCRLFVTNDTGPMHIAAAFGVPVAAIFGPTDWVRTAPFGAQHAVIRHPVDCAPCLLRECPIDHRCMTGIGVEQVVDAATRLLETMNDERETMNEALSEAEDVSFVQRSTFSAQRSALHGVTVFLDRDGTVNRDTGYVKSLEEFVIFPQALSAIARLKKAGARAVLVTNQSGIARGLIATRELDAIHAGLQASLQAAGAALDGIYVCPHHPDEGCGCRKPNRGLVDRAVVDLGLDLSRAYVVGDQKRDIELARRIGASAVLVMTGPVSGETLKALQAEGAPPDAVAADLSEAAEWILNDVGRLAHSTHHSSLITDHQP
jgi:heptosyltransferase-2